MPSYLKESLRQALEAMADRDGPREDDPRNAALGGSSEAASQRPDPFAGAERPARPRPPGAGLPPAGDPYGAPRPPAGRGPEPEDYDRADRPTLDPSAYTSFEAERPRINLPVSGRFRPSEPRNLEEAGLEPEFVKGLVVKYLLDHPGVTGRQLSAALCVNIHTIRALTQELKDRKLVVFRGATTAGDFNYELSEAGRNLALDLRRISRYAGPAPVTLEQYILSVHEQSITREAPRMKDLHRAFTDLLVPERLLHQLGPAMTSGRGLFLFGPPGNGKTSLAERMTGAFGTACYIPHAVLIEGQVVKVFDPMVHEELDEATLRGQSMPDRPDPRWVKCRRPTVVAGGELTMDNLEIDYDSRTGICEAPIQVKANCGTLVIDDFGRQRVDPATLLNRWIVPLEERHDYLRMPDGRKVRIPFDPLLVFSTNLDPRDLCDEAFLRRIPYKVNVEDPDEEAFRLLLKNQTKALGFEPDDDVYDYLIYTYYRKTGRPFRNCHPRDLLLQIQNQCVFREVPLKLSREGVDEAALSYFTLL